MATSLFSIGTLALALALALACSTTAACGGTTKRKPIHVPATPLSSDGYAHYLRGQIAVFDTDWRLAIKELREAALLEPNEAHITVALSRALFVGGNRQEGLAVIRHAQAQWPNDSFVWSTSAEIYSSYHKHKEALANFERACKLGAGLEVWLAYTHELIAAQKSPTALRTLRELVAGTLLHNKSKNAQIAEQQARVRSLLATVLYREGKFSEATTTAQMVVEETPYDFAAWAVLSASLRKDRKPEQANNALRTAFDRSAGSAYVSERLLEGLLEMGDVVGAQGLASILDRDDLPIDTRIGLRHLQMQAGDLVGAANAGKSLMQVATASKGSVGAISELRALAHRARQEHDAAISLLRAVPKDDPNDATVRARLSEVLSDLGRFKEAIETVASALVDHPNNPDLLFEQAFVYEKSGQVDKARALLQNVIDEHPNASRPLFAIAEFESRQGSPQTAIAIIKPLLTIDQSNASALNYIGYNLIDVDNRRAGDLLQQALLHSPDSAYILDSYGWLQLKLGKLALAARYLERAHRLSPIAPELSLHLAELRLLQARKTEARVLFDQAQSLATGPYLQKKIRSRQRILRQQP